MEVYRITTTGNDLQNDYSRVSTNWQFVRHMRGENDELMEEWTCETGQPAALEALLNSDSEVGTYASAE